MLQATVLTTSSGNESRLSNMTQRSDVTIAEFTNISRVCINESIDMDRVLHGDV